MYIATVRPDNFHVVNLFGNFDVCLRRRESLRRSALVSSARRRPALRREVLSFLGAQQGFGEFQADPGCAQDPKRAVESLPVEFRWCIHGCCCLTAHCQRSINCHP